MDFPPLKYCKYLSWQKLPNSGSQIDAPKIALSANQIDGEQILANPRAS